MKSEFLKFSLTKEEYNFIMKQVVTPIRELGAEVYCFGSRARGDNQEFSDLDLLIESQEDISQKISFLQEQLIESNFKYKVDLVLSKDLAESYKDNILIEKKEF